MNSDGSLILLCRKLMQRAVFWQQEPRGSVRARRSPSWMANRPLARRWLKL